jgi:hypothetical protein
LLQLHAARITFASAESMGKQYTAPDRVTLKLCAGGHAHGQKHHQKCIETIKLQQPFVPPGPTSSGIEPIFNDAASFDPPRPVLKFTDENLLYKGGVEPIPKNKVGATVVCTLRKPRVR